MTSLETFRVVAALAAAVITLGLLFAGADGNSPRRAGLLAALAGTWLLLAGSLVSRGDAERALDNPTAVGILLAVILLAGTVAVIVVVRYPMVWLALLAVTMPIRLPVKLGSLSANLLIPLYVVIGIGFVAAIVRARRGSMPHVTTSRWITLPLTVFVALTFVSMLWTSDWTEATSKLVFFYVPFLLLFHLVTMWWGLVGHRLRLMAATTVAVGVLAAVVALVQFLTRSIWWNSTLQQGNNYNRFFRTNGIFFDPNILGRFLALAIVIAVAYLAVTDERVQMAVVAVAIVILTAGLVVTFSRSSALMLMVGLMIMSGRFFGWRRSFVVGLSTLLVVGGGSLAASGKLREKFASTSAIAKASEGRARLVKGGAELWKQEPILGVGVGSFAQRYAETLPPRTRRRTRVVISHTAPVTVLAELGSVGIGAFGLLILGAGVGLIRGIRRNRVHGLVLTVVLALLAGIFVHAVLYSAFFEDPYVWVLLATGATFALAPAATAPPPTPTRRGRRPVLD